MSACTHKELSEIAFKPVSELDDMNHERKLAHVASVARIAIGLLGMSKEELIEFIRATADEDRSEESIAVAVLTQLDDGLKKLAALTGFITAARWRVASAAAVVYPRKRRRRKRAA
jgi:hypothetical protein